jgi:hypothetical protein
MKDALVNDRIRLALSKRQVDSVAASADIFGMLACLLACFYQSLFTLR